MAKGYDLDGELNSSVRRLRNAGVQARMVRAQAAYGIIWVDDAYLGSALDVLRNAGFDASEFPS